MKKLMMTFKSKFMMLLLNLFESGLKQALLDSFKAEFKNKSKFQDGDVIKIDGSKAMFQVEGNFYKEDMSHVTIVSDYPLNRKMYGISESDIKMYVRAEEIVPIYE